MLPLWTYALNKDDGVIRDRDLSSMWCGRDQRQPFLVFEGDGNQRSSYLLSWAGLLHAQKYKLAAGNTGVLFLWHLDDTYCRVSRHPKASG